MISTKLHKMMNRRQSMIKNVPGYKSGHTDRSSPLLHEVQAMDVEIIKQAERESIEVNDAWSEFHNKEELRRFAAVQKAGKLDAAADVLSRMAESAGDEAGQLRELANQLRKVANNVKE